MLALGPFERSVHGLSEKHTHTLTWRISDSQHTENMKETCGSLEIFNMLKTNNHMYTLVFVVPRNIMYGLWYTLAIYQ